MSNLKRVQWPRSVECWRPAGLVLIVPILQRGNAIPGRSRFQWFFLCLDKQALVRPGCLDNRVRPCRDAGAWERSTVPAKDRSRLQKVSVTL